MSPVASPRAAPAAPTGLSPQAQHQLDQATRQFEAMLLKRVLASLEKTTQVGSARSSGSNPYGGMLVEALSDAIAQAGGLGLARELAAAARQADGVTNEKDSR